MYYKIGEVSDLTNISKEMIRYYEKQGALSPIRKVENNYRLYSTMDVFLLMEIVRYQSMHFSVKEIAELIKDNYYEKYSKHLHHYHLQIDKNIAYLMMLKDRIKQLAVRSNHIHLNINNFWIKKIPDLDLVFLLEGQGDEYHQFETTPSNRKTLFTDDTMVFFESMIIFEKEKDTWWYSIRKEIKENLELNINPERNLKAEFCLCTIIDMGEIGEFNRTCLNSIYQIIQQKGYQIKGEPRGVIIGRGYEKGKFRRLMEIHVPIQV